jgi:mannose-6-phosphate isomerase
MIEINRETVKDYSALDSFVIYLCAEGIVEVQAGDGRVSMKTGEVVLLPAVLDEVTLIPVGQSKILEVYIS